MIQYPRYRQHRFSSFQVIIAGFAAVDLVGAQLGGDMGLRCLQALQEPRDGAVLYLLMSARYEPAGDQRLCYTFHHQFQG